MRSALATSASARGAWVPGPLHRWLLLPPLAVLLFAFVIPLLAILPQAFGLPSLKLASFERFFGSPVYLNVLVNTVVISATVAAITLVVAYPYAWAMSQAGPKLRAALALVVLVPLLTSALVVTFSWIAVLGREGLLNQMLVSLHIVQEPSTFLFSRLAVVLALIQTSIPLMVLPLVSVMQKIDTRTIRVAESLGAPRLNALLRTLVPLSLPGIRAGVMLVFLYSMAAFIAPAVLGGTSDAMVGQLIQTQIESGLDWGLAAALAIALIVVSLAIVAIVALGFGRLTPWLRASRGYVRANVPPAVSPGTAKRLASMGALALPRPTLDFLSRPRVLSAALRAYVALIALYILVPLLVVVPVSFTSVRALVFPPPGWSLRWFERVLSDDKWLTPAITSVEISAAVAVAACVLSLCATIGFGRRAARGRGTIETFISAPMAVPTIVFALGAYLVFARVGLVDSIAGIIVAQTVLVLPIAFLIISAGYTGVDERLEQAAHSLGAGRWLTLRKIVLPLMTPALVSAGLLTALLSFNESVASVFLSGVHVETLPRRMWEGIRFDTSPEVAAVSTILLVIAFAVLLIASAVAVRMSGRRSLFDVLNQPEK